MRVTQLFDTTPVVGEMVTGRSISRSFTSPWSGTYLGVRESEHDAGVMMHMFRGGAIGVTSQKDGLHGFPVDQVPANTAWLTVYDDFGDYDGDHLVEIISIDVANDRATVRHLGPIPRTAHRVYEVRDLEDLTIEVSA